MTRFLIPLDRAVDTIFAAYYGAKCGETYVPKMPSACIMGLALYMLNGKPTDIKYIGIRPGEKLHEVLISEDEARRTVERDGYYVICPILPELSDCLVTGTKEYTSNDILMSQSELKELLDKYLDVE
jgi:UDP-glucose 4-epimerase